MSPAIDRIAGNGRLLIFTDLDGTLLDYYTYSHEAVKPLVNRLTQSGIAVITCTSKTRAEAEYYRYLLDLDTPFIVENGGAIFISQDYFPFEYEYQRRSDGYNVIELGMPYAEVKRRLDAARKKNELPLRGFGDMSDDEVAELTGLDRASAGRARQREYGETLDLNGLEADLRPILDIMTEAGLEWTRGSRLYSVAQGSDKGKATGMLIDLYKRQSGRVQTIGLGDSPNDAPMLKIVDYPVLVQKPGSYWEELAVPNLTRVKGIGPEGWLAAVSRLTGISPD